MEWIFEFILHSMECNVFSKMYPSMKWIELGSLWSIIMQPGTDPLLVSCKLTQRQLL